MSLAYYLKLGSYFNIKDSAKLDHQHDLTYLTQCPEVNFNETYLRETARRLRERVLDHAGKDKKSNMVEHSTDKCHPLTGIYERLLDLNKGV